jgi:hypothetical protein
VTIAVAVAIAQCLRKPRHKPKLVQVFFSVSTLVISVMIAAYAGRWLPNRLAPGNTVPLLACSAPIYFGANTILLSGILSLTETKPIFHVWNKLYLWTFPHYLLSAALGGLFGYASRGANRAIPFLLMPGAWLVFSYGRAVARRQEDFFDPKTSLRRM